MNELRVSSLEYGVWSMENRGGHFEAGGGFSPSGSLANLSGAEMSGKNQGFPDLTLKMTVRLA